MRYFTVSWLQLAHDMTKVKKDRRIHFFKLSKNVAIIWDRKDGQ